MGKLKVNYSEIGTLQKTINKSITYFGKRSETIGGVKRNIDSVPSSRGYLDSAVSELYQREQKIDEKVEKLQTFSDQLEAFSKEAQEADQRVASRITEDTTSFTYTTGIGAKKTEKKSIFTKIKDAITDAWNGLKDWYNEHKEVILSAVQLVVDIALCALAVVAFVATLPASGFFAICGAIAAGFALAKSVADVVSSSISFYSYSKGDRKEGAEWADRGLEWYMKSAGGALDSWMNKHTGKDNHYIENFCGGLYTGFEVFSAIYGVASLGKTALKSFKLDKLKWKNLLNPSKAKRQQWLDKVNWKERFTDKKNWTSFGKNMVGVGTVNTDRRTKGYRDMKKSMEFMTKKIPGLSKLNDKDSIMALYKFKVRGSNAKLAADTVKSLFDPDKYMFENIKAIKVNKTAYDKLAGLFG